MDVSTPWFRGWNVIRNTPKENIGIVCCVQIMLSTAECLALLQQKPLGIRMQMPSSRDKDNMKPMGPLHAAAATNYHEGPMSSDVSPVSTVEKRACLLLPTRTSPQPFCGLNPPMALSNGCHHGVQYGNYVSSRPSPKSDPYKFFPKISMVWT